MNAKLAQHLRIKVIRDGEVKVDLHLPAQSALWIIKLLPDDIIEKIKNSNISLENIQTQFKTKEDLIPQEILHFSSQEKKIKIWLE